MICLHRNVIRDTHTQARTHARTHARMHARTHARTHTWGLLAVCVATCDVHARLFMATHVAGVVIDAESVRSGWKAPSLGVCSHCYFATGVCSLSQRMHHFNKAPACSADTQHKAIAQAYTMFALTHTSGQGLSHSIWVSSCSFSSLVLQLYIVIAERCNIVSVLCTAVLQRPFEEIERKLCSVCNPTHHVKPFLGDLDVEDFMWDQMDHLPELIRGVGLLSAVLFILHPQPGRWKQLIRQLNFTGAKSVTSKDPNASQT